MPRISISYPSSETSMFLTIKVFPLTVILFVQGCSLHRYFTVFKLNQWLVLLGVQTKLRGCKCLGVEMFLNRKYVCLPMTRNFFNKNEESVEQDFKILVKYEKVSG
jgi:hypothetical protein